VTLCFTNEGLRTLTLWGYGAADERRTVVEGEPTDQRIRLSYVRPGRESAWDVIGAVAGRMGVGRGEGLAGWAFYGWLAALAGLLAATAAAVLRGRA
jgi:hypothetical protein